MGGPDLVGQVLDGRYRVVTKLGAGAMATVYLARQESLKRQVVVKVPDPMLLRDERFRIRFQREIGSLTKLRHPNVVSVFEAGEIDGIPYLVMEYLPGGSLGDRLRNKDLEGNSETLEEILAWLRPIASALDYIHSQDVVHRDVKPGNILFDASGNPFLSDFGIAKALTQEAGELTMAAGSPGTPGYIPPEVLENRILPQFDQYSLGALVIRAITGEPPKISPMRSGALEKVLGARLTPDAIKVLTRATAWEPEERFRTCGEFVEALAAAVQAATMVDATGAFDFSAAARSRLEGRSLEQEVSIEVVQPIGPDDDFRDDEVIETAVPVGAHAALEAVEARPGRRRLGVPLLIAGLFAVVLVVVAFLVLGNKGKGEPGGGGSGGTDVAGNGPPGPGPGPGIEPEPPPDPVPGPPPRVAVLEPGLRDVLTREASILFSGRASGAPGSSVRVGEFVVQPDASGAFEVRVPLEEGENRVQVVPVAPGGQEGEAESYTVTRDSTPPVLTLTRPKWQEVTRHPELQVAGSVADAPGGEVRIDGRSVPLDADGGFSTIVVLEEGVSTFRLVATDAAGNESAPVAVEVTLDSTAPSLILDTPETSLTPRVEIRGQSNEDGSRVAVGYRTTRVEDGAFVLVLDLKPGENRFTLTLTDGAGNVTEKVFTIRRIDRETDDYGLTAGIDAPKSVAVGESVPFVLTVTNGGGIALEDVRITVELGGGIEVEEASATDREPVVLEGSIQWGGFGLSAGARESLTLAVRPTREGDRRIAVKVAARDPELGRAVPAGAELFLDVSPLRLLPEIRAVPESVAPGGTVDLQLRVVNPGELPVRNVLVEVGLPAALAAAPGRPIAFEVPAVAGGDAWSVTLPVTARSAGEALASIRIRAAGVEREVGTTVLVEALAPPPPAGVAELSLSIWGLPTAGGSNTGRCEARVANRGTAAATGVVVVVDLPDGVVPGGDALIPAGEVSGNRMTFQVGTLAPGEERTLSGGYRVTDPMPGTRTVRGAASFTGGAAVRAEGILGAQPSSSPASMDMALGDGRDGDVTIESVRVGAPFYYIANFVNQGSQEIVVRFSFEASQDLLRTNTPVGLTDPKGETPPTSPITELDPRTSGGFSHEVRVRGRRQVFVMIPVVAGINAGGRRVGIRVQAVFRAVNATAFSEPVFRYETTIVNP